MRFKHEESKQEYEFRLHPRAHLLAVVFEAESARCGWPEPLITCIARTPEQNKADGGAAKSWHLFSCAIDFSVHDYTEEQHAEVVAWFEAHCTGSEWELITKPHGTGPHIHVAYRAFDWRKKEQPHG